MTDLAQRVSGFEAWDPEAAREITEALAHLQGACLPILHALQARFGYIDKEAIPIIANVLNVSRAEVVGIVSFYHDFRDAPPGAHVLRVCRAESCQAMGADQLVNDLSHSLGTSPGATSPDGSVTFNSVYCLGNCALSPAATLDDRLLGRVTHERITTLLAGAPS